MGTKETLEAVARMSVKNNTYKVGGRDIGRYSNLRDANILRSVLNIFLKLEGRPKGFVFSAPAGLTSELHKMFRMSVDGATTENLLYDFSFDVCQEFKLAWVLMSQTFGSLVKPNERESYELLVAKLNLEISKSLRAFQLDARNSFDGIHNHDRDYAIIGSLGERLLGSFIMKPMCQIMTKFFGMRFVYIDPINHITPASSYDGYMRLEPDIFKSVESLRGLIKKEDSDKTTFVMPGFYMALSSVGREVALMPYNGSDISAYLLALAMDNPPIFVKNIIGAQPTSVQNLHHFQRNVPSEIGSKPEELIADFVLKEMISREEGLLIFDTAKSSLCAIPVLEKKIAV